MSSWSDLDRELDAWRCNGAPATLWWRDDDATRVTPPLERLLGLSRQYAVPLALAVIPRDREQALVDRLSDETDIWVLQHGWSHENHAPAGSRQDELGPERSIAMRLDELAAGWRQLEAFPRRLPVLVAPWNRLDPDLVAHLPAIGLNGLSTLGPRPRPGDRNGTGTGDRTAVRQTNVHVDLIDWAGSRGFFGTSVVLDQLLAHLRARREAYCDPGEPTGVMSHHLFHDEGCWAFLAALFERTAADPRVRWLAAPDAFAP